MKCRELYPLEYWILGILQYTSAGDLRAAGGPIAGIFISRYPSDLLHFAVASVGSNINPMTSFPVGRRVLKYFKEFLRECKEH